MGRTSDKRPTADEALKILLERNQRFVESEPIIADIAKEGKVKITPACYDLPTGKVSLL